MLERMAGEASRPGTWRCGADGSDGDAGWRRMKPPCEHAGANDRLLGHGYDRVPTARQRGHLAGSPPIFANGAEHP